MRLLVVSLLFLSAAAHAQFTYEINQTIPVLNGDGEPLALPWGGGLNAVQINSMDLNEDGKSDLVIFERMADAVLTFIQNNNAYQYAPEYEILFPEGITNWLLLRDYNGDGRKDIFTGDILGVKVYINTTETGQSVSWEQFLFYKPGSAKSPLLLTKGSPPQKINLQMNYDDLPAIRDADGDGDLDIFSPQSPGGSTIEYHRNYSMERYGTRDSLDFERITQTWGGVQECACGVFAFNNEACNEAGRLLHAGGKSLFAFDVDNDGDQDMLFSEAECDTLFLFENTSNVNDPSVAVVTSAVPYPESFSLVNFPAPYYEDVDFDGIKDLLVSPNLFEREFSESNFRESVWFYKNTGTEAQPVFSTSDHNFLQGDMIDVGDNAVPAFFDVDTDGDEDLFIGCYINNDLNAGTVYFFENTGTSTQPQFRFVTDNYLDLSDQSFLNLKPMFADMNGDAKIDFVFTAQEGSTTQLYYIFNSGTTAADFSGEIIPSGFFVIWRDENVHVTDVNTDGKNDLLIGKLNGAIEYQRNTGTAASPVYTLEDPNFLNLSSSVLRQTPAITTSDLNDDGKADLIYADQTGVLTIISNYRNVDDASGSITEIIFNPITDNYSAKNMGGRGWPTTVQLFDRKKPQLVVGNILGGLHILKHDEGSFLSEAPQIDVYPNPIPANDEVFHILTDQTTAVQLITMVGQQIGGSIRLEANQVYDYKIIPQLKGMYLLRFIINGRSYVRKIVIR